MGAYRYEIIPDFFSHKLAGAPLKAVPERFGLNDESDDRWTQFRAALAQLNEEAGESTLYKLIFCIRHGQGYHNAAEIKYGKEAWDNHWAKLEGDGELVWGPDPLLTPAGVDQAKEVRRMWDAELGAGLGIPSKIYSSPFSRALRTGFITFDGLLEDDSKVLIVENCREENGVHTCDKRSTASFIRKEFPKYTLEEGFAEEDELWSADVRETKGQVAARANLVLDRIFDENVTDHVLAITAHSGFIDGILLALGHKPYLLPTGGVLPLVLKATRSS